MYLDTSRSVIEDHDTEEKRAEGRTKVQGVDQKREEKV
jgi:hypothetical protein